MIRNNTMCELRENILDSGGKILFNNHFESWTTEPQEEIVARLWNCIIYGQTKMGFLQPCWVHCEHFYSTDALSIASSARKYYLRGRGEYTHAVFQFYPKELMCNLKNIRDFLQVNSSFTTIPDLKFFHLLNHSEIVDSANDVFSAYKMTLKKIELAKLEKFFFTSKPYERLNSITV